MFECNDKMVSHPSHYQGKNGLEAIDVIEAFTSELSGIDAVDTANVLKYMLRWKSKNGVQDLKKAQWYLTHLIERLEDKGEENRDYMIIDQLPLFHSLTAAEDMLNKMKYCVESSGFVSVHKFYDLCDLTHILFSTTDLLWPSILDVYGWTDLSMVKIVKTNLHLYTFDNLPEAVKVK